MHPMLYTSRYIGTSHCKAFFHRNAQLIGMSLSMDALVDQDVALILQDDVLLIQSLLWRIKKDY